MSSGMAQVETEMEKQLHDCLRIGCELGDLAKESDDMPNRFEC